MRCLCCDRENRDDARFCDSCGASLASRCPGCRTEVRREARFCDSCGLSLEESPSSSTEREPGATVAHLALRDGERRQITVLFCDLVGSTAMSARTDPEDWSEVIRSYQRVATEVVARFGGYVAQYLGDGILVYFGWPQAHDDDAERAVRAGLGILHAVSEMQPLSIGDIEVAVRIGIHTGAVVVTEIGGRERNEVLALGETPNVAAHVQALTPSGTVAVTADTHRLVAGLFVVEESGTHTLKGVKAPIVIYRVLAPSGVRGRLNAAAARGLTPFIGRQEERRLLASRWERAAEGEGQVVLLLGDAGIGKSRLLQVFREDLQGEPHTWIECSGSPYHPNTPFFAVTEMLRQALAWRGDESIEERTDALERSLERAGLNCDGLLPLIAPLLDLPVPDRYAPLLLSAVQQRRRLLAALCDWVFGSARLQPMVIVLEDLHWVDPSTLELQTLLAEQAATQSLLLLYTARPEFSAPWPVRAHHTQLTLNRLSRGDVRTLVQRVAKHASLSPDIVEAVVARTDGVPLFAEELTKAVLGGSAMSERDIPSTLHDSLMARLDRLGPAKEIAQVGAVIGREFYYGLFHAVLPLPEQELQAALAKLADAELLYARGLPPEATYLFKHALLQDAAYAALLKTRRRELHRAVADALLQRFPLLAESQPEVVAHHLTEGGQAERAVHAWQKAADRAVARAALGEAASHYARALDALLTLPETTGRDQQEIPLQIALGQVRFATRGYAAPETMQPFARARELGESLGDPNWLLFVLIGLWVAALNSGELRAAEALAEQLRELAERDSSSAARVWALLAQGVTRSHLGDPAASLEHLTQLIAVYEEDEWRTFPVDPGVTALGYAAITSFERGRVDDAHSHILRSQALARRLDKGHDLAVSHYFGALLHGLLGDPRRAEEHADACILLAREHELPVFGANGAILRGWALVEQGRGAEGLAQLREGVASYLATGQRLGLGFFLTLLADAQGRAGMIEEGLVTIEDALTAVPEEGIDRPHALRMRGKLLELQGLDPPGLAEASYRASLVAASKLGAKAYELRAATSLGRLLCSRGRHAEARMIVEPLLDAFEQGFDTEDVRAAAALVASIDARR